MWTWRVELHFLSRFALCKSCNSPWVFWRNFATSQWEVRFQRPLAAPRDVRPLDAEKIYMEWPWDGYGMVVHEFTMKMPEISQLYTATLSEVNGVWAISEPSWWVKIRKTSQKYQWCFSMILLYFATDNLPSHCFLYLHLKARTAHHCLWSSRCHGPSIHRWSATFEPSTIQFCVDDDIVLVND